MMPSEWDGQSVTYVDPLKMTHTGAVVGQSEDGQWVYVQSDNPDALLTDWHFKVKAEWMPAILDKRKA